MTETEKDKQKEGNQSHLYKDAPAMTHMQVLSLRQTKLE